MIIDGQLINSISSELAEYKDDSQAFWDTLDGETDVMQLVGTIIEEIVEADEGQKMVSQIIEKYSTRRTYLKSKTKRLRKSLEYILMSTGQKSIPHPFATISMRGGSESLNIYDEASIPSQLTKTTTTPDTAEIKKQIKAGVQIDGAELVTGPEILSLRMK